MSVNAPSSNSPTQQPTNNSAATPGGMTSSDFLQLLVGELQNQDPLQPTSTTDFINQMSQYANFNSQQNLNTQLGNLISSFNNILTMNSVNYLGHSIQAKGDTATLQNGQVQFGYSLTAAAKNVTLTVADQKGNVVWSGTGATTAGLNSFNWNGKTTNGTQLADGGQYTLKVTATDDQGNSVYNYSTFVGTVTAIDNSSGVMMLNVGGSDVNVNDIVGVKS